MTMQWSLITLSCLFMLLDIVSGFAQACKNNCIDSQKLKEGLWHKCGFILAIAFACLCEFTMQFVDLGFTVPLQTAVCVYIILTEVVSILENLAKISPELANSKFMELFASVNNDLTDSAEHGTIDESAAPTLDQGSNLSESTGERPCGGSEDIC